VGALQEATTYAERRRRGGELALLNDEPLREEGRVKLSVIIPALNEEESLPVVLAELPWPMLYQVIVVDNGSQDRTAEVASAGGALVVREPQRGYGSACMAGMRAAPEADVLIFLDADGSFDANEIARLVGPIAHGEVELVLGSRLAGRREPGAMPFHGVVGNWLVATVIGHLAGMSLTDLGPFRAIKRQTLERLRMEERTYGWPSEMIVKAAQLGVPIREIPVRYRRRRGGYSKVSGTWRGTLGATYRILKVTYKYARLVKGS
jgi:glycosyltransferase involved in cell wall biosynthesis